MAVAGVALVGITWEEHETRDTGAVFVKYSLYYGKAGISLNNETEWCVLYFCGIVLTYEAAGVFTSSECHEQIGGFKIC